MGCSSGSQGSQEGFQLLQFLVAEIELPARMFGVPPQDRIEKHEAGVAVARRIQGASAARVFAMADPAAVRGVDLLACEHGIIGWRGFAVTRDGRRLQGVEDLVLSPGNEQIQQDTSAGFAGLDQPRLQSATAAGRRSNQQRCGQVRSSPPRGHGAPPVSFKSMRPPK